MTTVAITGAAGEVGRVVTPAFDDVSLALFTHRQHDDVDGRVLDVTDADAFVDALADADAGVLVHLAWGPADETAWGDHATNLAGVANAYDAALAAGLDRVVFASSVHAVGMYDRDDPAEMETLAAGADTTVATEDPARPDSLYGVAKVAAEAMGSYHADRHGLEVVNLRIGWLLSREELREVDGSPGRVRFARATWLSHRDCRAVVRAAALAPVSETPLTLHAVSRNADRHLSLTPTMRRLGYRPRDDAAEVLE